jgi:hypothetical protein
MLWRRWGQDIEGRYLPEMNSKELEDYQTRKKQFDVAKQVCRMALRS